jgi:hypothetical protein
VPSSPSRGFLNRPLVWLALGVCLAGRIGFGLASNFWTDDERQVYLIGLQSFAHHAWPYYGADIVWTGSRLPGALQGLLIAWPLSLVPEPESPVVFLNLVSFSALAGFAWYLCRRLPVLPPWLVWGWLMTAPWTLHFSTHVVNTSYVLPAAILFFVGFFEATPALSAGLVRPIAAWGLMGFGLAWIVQMHLSWVLLPAYVCVAALSEIWRARRPRVVARHLLRSSVGFITGAAVPGVFLAPTILRGGSAGLGGMERNVSPHWPSVSTFVSILGKWLSFAGPEINRFIGLDTAQRLGLLASHPWLVPPAVVLFVMAIVVPVALLITGLRARSGDRSWDAVRLLAAGTVAWVYASYAFSIREAQAHAFYVVFPVATLFAMSAWAGYIGRPGFRRTAAAVLVVNVLFQAGFALAVAPDRSLYRDRALAARAIAAHEDRWLGERRVAAALPAALAFPAPSGPAGFDQASAREDLHVEQARWSRSVFGRVSTFDLTIRNTGHSAAYVDLRYRATYTGADGREVATSDGLISEILQPGAVRRWPGLVDGLARRDAVSATLAILDADRVVPAGGVEPAPR